MRRVRVDEHEAAGRVAADAYREFAADGDDRWSAYLHTLADVPARASRSVVLVAVDAAGINGTATVEMPEGPEAPAHVRMLGVRPGRRREGIGRALLTGCMDVARVAGRSGVTLHTTEQMSAAQAMYESMGFRRLSDEEIGGERLLTYHLTLRR